MRPRGGGDKISVHAGLIDGDVLELAARQRDFRSARRIGGALAPLQNSRGS